MSYIVYGIKNCDTVKKALTWLKQNNIAFDFHDFKTKGIDEKKLKVWSAQKGWENLINKKGLTWRKLDESIQHSITTETAAFKLMQDKTSVIKRPILEHNEKILFIGFDEKQYESFFK